MTTSYRRTGERLFDRALTVPALSLRSLVMGLVALLVRQALGEPVLFRQRCPGLHGEPFTMFRCRSVIGARDADAHLPMAPHRGAKTAERLAEMAQSSLRTTGSRP